MSKLIYTFLKFKKHLLIAAVLAVFILIPNAARAQTQSELRAAEKSWNAFWTKFSAAVRTKNRKAFVALTSKNFKSGGGETIHEWLDYNPWRDLRSSVNRGTKSYVEYKPEIWRITRDEGLLFVYEKKKGWRFFGELIA